MNKLLNINFIVGATMEPRLFDLDLQLLADAVLMMIAVLALFVVLSYFLFNPARKMLTGRQEKIKGELAAAAASMKEANALKAQYEEKLNEIDKEAEQILSEARKQALASENKIVQEAKEDAVRIIARAREEAQLQKKKVVDEVKVEMISIASIMAGKVVAASIDTTVQDSLITETLKEVGESTWLS